MTDNLRAFWLGLFIVIAMVLGAWLILFIRPNVGDGKVKLTVLFSNIEKISKGTLVTYAGKEVGFVKEIVFLKDHREACKDALGNLYIFKLILQVDSSVKVYLYDDISFATAGLLGERSVAIVPKAAPFGAAPAHEVTQELLFARSTDKLEHTMQQIVTVATAFQDTLQQMGTFIETNNRDFNETLKSVNLAATEVKHFMQHANQNLLVDTATSAFSQANNFFASANENAIFERLGTSFDSLNEAAFLFAQGQGTVARLVNSDCVYVQLRSVMCELQRVLSDISNYGLFYQFSSKWQKNNKLRRYQTALETHVD